MIMLETSFNAGIGMSPEIAAKLSQHASKYTASILIRLGNRELMLDSLIGILSVEMPRGTEITVIADGEDERSAAEDICNVLSGK